ncbi:Sjogren's syndrome/scleroderma autoantigen 1 family protein [Stetteria hydrogenophila]
MSGRSVDRAEAVKRMAALLQQGAAMLAETCPICGLPLFRLRSGEVVCPIHGRVVIVSSDEEAREVEIDAVVAGVEYEAASRIRDLLGSGSPREIREWLEVIEAAERIRGLREARRGGGGKGSGVAGRG